MSLAFKIHGKMMVFISMNNKFTTLGDQRVKLKIALVFELTLNDN